MGKARGEAVCRWLWVSTLTEVSTASINHGLTRLVIEEAFEMIQYLLLADCNHLRDPEKELPDQVQSTLRTGETNEKVIVVILSHLVLVRFIVISIDG